jgi:hypothetical protein
VFVPDKLFFISLTKHSSFVRKFINYGQKVL